MATARNIHTRLIPYGVTKTVLTFQTPPSTPDAPGPPGKKNAALKSILTLLLCHPHYLAQATCFSES